MSDFNLDLNVPQADGEVDKPGKSSEGMQPQNLLKQVYQWLQDEKSKRVTKKFSKADVSAAAEATEKVDLSPSQTAESGDHARKRSDSDVSEGALALDRLERILAEYAAIGKESIDDILQGRKPSSTSRRSSLLLKKSKRGSMVASSDTEYTDTDVIVPNADVWLDNTKTMSYTGGTADAEGDEADKSKEHESWVIFKREIVRLAHTLKLKGWRRIPIEKGEIIDVERLSGALTNAVYVVSPPKKIPEPSKSQESLPLSKKPPP